MLMIPAFVTAAPSRMIDVSVSVIAAGREIVPVRLIVPPLHVMDVPVTLMGNVPASVPARMVSVWWWVGVGRVVTVVGCGRLGVSVPPMTRMSPVAVGLLIVVVAPLFFVVPVTL